MKAGLQSGARKLPKRPLNRKRKEPKAARVTPPAALRGGKGARRIGSAREAAGDLVQAMVRSAIVAGIGAGLAWLIVAGHHFFTTSEDFAVREVQMIGLSRVTPEALKARMQLAEGENIFAVDVDAAVARGLEDPWVRDIRVSRRLPDRLEVMVEEHQPRMLAALGGLYLVDDHAEVFKRLRPGELLELPVVTGLDREAYQADEAAARERLQQALEIVEDYEEKGPSKRIALSEVHLEPEIGATLYLGEKGIEVEVAAQDRAERRRQLARLEVLLGVMQERGEEPRVVKLDHRKRRRWATVLLAQK